MPRRVTAVLLVLLFALAGCTGGPPTGKAVPSPPPTPATVLAPATERPPPSSLAVRWRSELPVIGAAVAVRDVAVVYTAADGVLRLVGVDPASGEQLWSQLASPAYVVPGIAIEPTVVEDAEGTEYAVYYRPPAPLTSSLNASVVVADPRTGADVVSADRAVYRSPLRSCDDGLDVCFDVDLVSQGQVTRRLRLADGVVRDEPRARGYVREIGPLGLSDVRTADGEFLARVEDGKQRWKTSIETAFGPGYSTDGGWGWEHYEEQGLLVGSVGRTYVGGVDDEQVIDLALTRTVALDVGTGAVVWRHDGSRLHCVDTLPRPLHPDRGTAATRCTYRGTLTVAPDGEPRFRGLDVTAQGFDPATGETTWDLEMGAAEDLFWYGDLGGVVNGREIVLPAPAGPRVIDLFTSRTRAPDADEVFGCVTTPEFDYDDAYFLGDAPVTGRLGGTLVSPCRGDGTTVDADLPTATVVATATVLDTRTPLGTIYLVAAPGGLVGYAEG